jgi:hypothetical protein
MKLERRDAGVKMLRRQQIALTALAMLLLSVLLGKLSNLVQPIEAALVEDGAGSQVLIGKDAKRSSLPVLQPIRVLTTPI